MGWMDQAIGSFRDNSPNGIARNKEEWKELFSTVWPKTEKKRKTWNTPLACTSQPSEFRHEGLVLKPSRRFRSRRVPGGNVFRVSHSFGFVVIEQ